MSYPDFQWIFPSASPNTTSPLSFTAQNASSNSTGFDKAPEYTGPNGSRSRTGVAQPFSGPSPIVWTIEFLSTPSLSTRPTTHANSSAEPNSGQAEDICVFLHENITYQTAYLTTAFTILNTTRQGRPYLFTAEDPFGSPYTPLSDQPVKSKHVNTKLAAILGSVLGCLTLLAVVVALMFWGRKRKARENSVTKEMVGENPHVGWELQQVRSVTTSLPPAYEERVSQGGVGKKVNTASAEERDQSGNLQTR